jgi:dihydrolipoamide dehydrogenase
MEQFDLIIIGSGPAGAGAAFKARSLGLSVCLVEKADIGGACLNRGCIPTKTLLHGAALLRDVRDGERYGLIAGTPCPPKVGLDFAKLIAWKNTVVQGLRKNQAAALVKAGVRIEIGEARIEGPGKVGIAGGNAAEERLLEGRAILVAVGTVPGRIPVPGSDLPGVYTSDDFLDGEGILPVPPRLVIVGGGVIGVEFAAAYSAFGSEVTIIEALDSLLANMDREIGQSLALQFKKRGITIKTNARIAAIEKSGGGLRVLLDNGPTAEADAILMATGRKPDALSLFAPGCAPALTEKGFIKVDENLMSSVPGIYAAGDITGGVGGLQLAHAAEAQGQYAAERVAGSASAAGWLIPACVYTVPEIACAGLSLAEAGARGIPAAAGKGVFGANGRATLENMDRGFVKLVFHTETRALIGAQFFCNHATEIIPWALQCIQSNATAEEIAGTVFPHPSYSETIAGAARDALGRGGLANTP